MDVESEVKFCDEQQVRTPISDPELDTLEVECDRVYPDVMLWLMFHLQVVGCGVPREVVQAQNKFPTPNR